MGHKHSDSSDHGSLHALFFFFKLPSSKLNLTSKTKFCFATTFKDGSLASLSQPSPLAQHMARSVPTEGRGTLSVSPVLVLCIQFVNLE